MVRAAMEPSANRRRGSDLLPIAMLNTMRSPQWSRRRTDGVTNPMSPYYPYLMRAAMEPSANRRSDPNGALIAHRKLRCRNGAVGEPTE
jgi:hypothetical protein